MVVSIRQLERMRSEPPRPPRIPSRPTTRPSTRATTPPQLRNTGGGGGGGGGGSQNIEPPKPRKISIPNIPLEDATYLAQIASINRALADFETQAGQSAQRYGTDYLTGVRQLGYRPSEAFTGMPDVLQIATQRAQAAASPQARTAAAPEPVVSAVSGQWDIEGQYSPYSAAARGTRSLRDEFAARGTLKSSDFGTTFGEFQNRLQEQLNAMETARTRFGEDLVADIMGQRTSAEERRQQARREAASRQAAAQANAYMRALAGG